MDTNTHAVSAPPISSGLKQPYHLVEPSLWPIIGAIGGGMTAAGIVLVAHYNNYTLLVLGLLVVLTTMFFWWRNVVHESRMPGLHSPVMQLSLRYGMTLFITSEVFFFVAFFWAYFNYALYPEHVAGNTAGVWPPPGVVTMDPFHLPLLNTLILLLSGTTITWAHHSLLEKNRRGLITGLAITVALGVSFLICQGIEYSGAPFRYFDGGIFPSVFFLTTGFHGFHVFVGSCFLAVCLLRAIAGQFTVQRHFGFEAAAWYWHFVDVVWLFLFIVYYWWGASPVVAS